MNKLKNILPQNIMLAIYNSLILSHINYAIFVWGYQFDRIYKIKKLWEQSLEVSTMPILNLF